MSHRHSLHTYWKYEIGLTVECQLIIFQGSYFNQGCTKTLSFTTSHCQVRNRRKISWDAPRHYYSSSVIVKWDIKKDRCMHQDICSPPFIDKWKYEIGLTVECQLIIFQGSYFNQGCTKTSFITSHCQVRKKSKISWMLLDIIIHHQSLSSET